MNKPERLGIIKGVMADVAVLKRCLELIDEAPAPLNVFDTFSTSHLQSTKGVLLDGINEKLKRLLKLELNTE